MRSGSCAARAGWRSEPRPLQPWPEARTGPAAVDALTGNPGVNCNIYDGKDFVWLNGGPAAGGLGPDGQYFFAVLVPGGQPNPNDGGPKNLSDDFDAVGNRTFTVTNGEVSTYSGSHTFDSGSGGGVHPNGKPPFIRLFPYADTTNPGGVYIMAICSLGAGYPVDPKGCKYDAFKVRSAAKVQAVLSGAKYLDANHKGQRDKRRGRARKLDDPPRRDGRDRHDRPDGRQRRLVVHDEGAQRRIGDDPVHGVRGAQVRLGPDRKHDRPVDRGRRRVCGAGRLQVHGDGAERRDLGGLEPAVRERSAVGLRRADLQSGRLGADRGRAGSGRHRVDRRDLPRECDGRHARLLPGSERRPSR